jgi:parallel beta-helix repeat protein
MSAKRHTHAGALQRGPLRWVVFLLVALSPTIIARAAPTLRDARAVLASPANQVAVTTTADSADGDTSSFLSLNDQPGPDGAISLREALMAANNTLPLTQTLTISFSIPISDTAYDSSSAAWTISVGSVDGTALPRLARGNVQVDASTQPGAGGHPRVVLDGYNVYEAAGANNGLTITSSNNVVRGFALANFFDYGILLSGASAANNQVSGCYVGTDARGVSEQPNGSGVRIEAGAHDNTIGGATPAERNLISGNTLYIVGVWISDAATVNNVVANNWIGVDASGQAPLANKWAGVYVSNGAHDNRIGGAGQGNLISGNERGVYLDSGAASTTVAGNTIGLAADGKTALPNSDGGVFIAHGAHDNRIGGATSGARNIISGNGVNPTSFGQGVYISDPNTTANLIQGNYIGADATGNLPVGNARQGVLITFNAQNNMVGGTAGAGNVIAYNGLGGIRLDAPSNQVAGNLIGVGANGTIALGNQQNGVRVFGDANVVGPDNVIANNYHSGIMTSASNTTIISNTLRDNARSGICVAGAGTTIRGNQIIDNGGADGSWPDCNIQGGVVITGTSNTEVVNNTIRGNHGAGITVRGGLNNRILANSISENSTVGILLLEGGNDNIAPPSIGRATPSSISGTACAGCHIEIFFTDSSNQGRDLIGTMTAASNGFFSLAPSMGILQTRHVTATNTEPNGKTRHVTATNTDPDGNTSSFALPVEVTPDESPSPKRVYLPLVVR